MGQNKGIINSSRLSELPAFEENIKMYNDLAVNFSWDLWNNFVTPLAVVEFKARFLASAEDHLTTDGGIFVIIG